VGLTDVVSNFRKAMWCDFIADYGSTDLASWGATLRPTLSKFQSPLCSAIIRSGQRGRERVLVMQPVQHRAGTCDRSVAQLMPGSLIVREMQLTEMGCSGVSFDGRFTVQEETSN
jgi:hypothetical protein